ncbi:hypothetical protein BSKO_04727 [Bryopsis sp. KO-2023]|nr:hypothetical protein BSKO_04727 [Bryopsis sp. KO-2023]
MSEGVCIDGLNRNVRNGDHRLSALRSRTTCSAGASFRRRDTRASARRGKAAPLSVDAENVFATSTATPPEAPWVPPSPVAINKSLVSARSADAVLEVVSMSSKYMNNVNLATAFHRIGKLGTLQRHDSQRIRDDPSLQVLVGLIMKRMDSFRARAIGSMAWAHAEFQHGGPHFMERLLERFVWVFERSPESFGDKELGGVLCACGKLEVGSDTIEKISPVLLRKIDEVRERCTVHVIWTCAQLRHSDEELLRKCENALRKRVGGLTLQGQGNTVWALAKLGRFDDGLFKELANCCKPRMGRANVIDVANFAWGFGKYFDHLAEGHIMGKHILEGDLYSDMEKLYFGLIADKGYDDFVRVLCNRAGEILRQRRYSNITFISAMMWFLGVVRVKDINLLEKLCSSTMRHSQHLQPQSLATVLWCLAKQRHRDVDLLDCLAGRGLAMLGEGGNEEMNGQTISMCLYSYASLSHVESEVSQRFIQALQEAAIGVLGTCSTQGIANIAWAVVTIGNLPEELLKEITMEVTRRTMDSTLGVFTDVEMTMLHQVQLLLRLEAPHIVMDSSNSQPANELFRMLYEVGRTRTHAEKKWEEEVVVPTPKVSLFHIEVLEALRGLGVECEVEFIDGYSIDIAMVEARIAIEVDGPSHFTSNSLKPLGGTLLKRRVLKGRGWEVFPVPFFEWEKYHSVEERMAYVQQKLFQLGVTLPIERKLGPSKENLPGGGDISDGSEVEAESREIKSSQTGGSSQTGDLENRSSRIDMMKYKRGAATKHDLLLRKAKRNIRSKRGKQNDS